MAVIHPEERVAMASLHMVGRSAAGAIGPSVTTAMWNIMAAWTPLVGSSLLKIGYDLCAVCHVPERKATGGRGAAAEAARGRRGSCSRTRRLGSQSSAFA